MPVSPLVLCDGSTAEAYLARRRSGETMDAALEALSADGEHWHAAPLDCVVDERPRVMQLVAGLQVGGAERVALSLHAGLPRAGVASRLAVVGRSMRTAYGAPPGTMFLASRGDRRAQAGAAGELAVRLGLDVVHAHLLSGAELRSVSASGVPVAATLHNAEQGWPPGLVEADDAVSLWIGCSKSAAEEFRAKSSGSEVRVIWNGVTVAEGGATRGMAGRLRLGLPPEALVVLAVANFRPQKRLERLPSVCARLASLRRNLGDGREVVLVVAGEASSGAGEPAVRAFDRAVAASRVRCVRLGSVADLGPLRDAADILVSVSEHEGLSLAQLEALASGLPVVATDVGGASEIAALAPDMVTVPAFAGDDEVAGAVSRAVSSRRGYISLLPTDFSEGAMVRRHAFFMARLAEWGACRGALRRGVVFVTNNLSPGGAQSGARRLIGELIRRGVPCRVWLLQESADSPTPGTLALREAGVSVNNLEGPLSLDPLFADCEAAPPRAVFLWNAIPESKVMIAEGLSGVRIFDASPGEMFYSSLRRHLARPREGSPVRNLREYARLLSGVVVKYAGAAAEARAELGVEPAVVFNGVALPEVCAEPLSGGERPWVVTLARISPQKKLEELLAAFALAHARGCVAGLLIAGGVEPDCDAYAARLREASANLPVEWLGHTEDIGPVLRRAGIFAMISEPAGCPNASLEAMAHGLPVVATDFGAVREQVVCGETGYVTPRGDAQAMSDAIISLAGEPERRAAFGKAGRARAERLFSVARMADGYERLMGGR